MDSGPKLYDITESFNISGIKYAAPSWCGFVNHEHIKQLQSLLNKLMRLNYLPSNYPKIKSIIASLDERLFSRVTVTRTTSHFCFFCRFFVCLMLTFMTDNIQFL